MRFGLFGFKSWSGWTRINIVILFLKFKKIYDEIWFFNIYNICWNNYSKWWWWDQAGFIVDPSIISIGIVEEADDPAAPVIPFQTKLTHNYLTLLQLPQKLLIRQRFLQFAHQKDLKPLLLQLVFLYMLSYLQLHIHFHMPNMWSGNHKSCSWTQCTGNIDLDFLQSNFLQNHIGCNYPLSHSRGSRCIAHMCWCWCWGKNCRKCSNCSWWTRL